MNAFFLILQMLPAIIKAVRAIEEAIPGNGQGKQKLSTVLDILTALEPGLSGVLPKLTDIIAIIVKSFNTTGQFTHSETQLERQLG
jgi:hypothetical protein